LSLRTTSSILLFLCLCTFSFAGTPGTFTLGLETVSGGKGLSRIAFADFNGDGRLDVAAGHSESNNVTIHLGIDTQGSFASGAVIPLPMWVSTLATGDFNGDGKMDVAAGSGSIYSQLAILLGQGDGTFAPAISVELSWYAITVASGDINADGISDMVTAENVILGSRSGEFTAITHPAAASFYSLTIVDVNGDHKPDVVGVGPREFTVLLGNGDGTFVVVDEPFSRTGMWDLTSPWSSYNTTSGALGDLNNDGILDLAVTTRDNYLYIFHGRGDGTFADGAVFLTGGNPSAVGIGDYNADGRGDIVVAFAETNRIYLYPGLPDGTVGNVAGNIKTLYGNGAMHLVDFSGDGLVDVITAGQNPDVITTYRNAPEPSEDVCAQVTKSPAVSFCTPADDSVVGGSVRIVALTKSDALIYGTALYLDDKLVGRSGERFDLVVSLTPGKHHLVVQAWDAAGRILNSSIWVTSSVAADPPPCPLLPALPSVTFCSPTIEYSDSSYVRVVAAGQSAFALTALQLYIDGTYYGGVVNRNVIDYTPFLSPGKHVLEVKGWDASGQSFSSFREVIVLVPLGTASNFCGPTTIYPSIRFCSIKPGDRFLATGMYLNFLAEAKPHQIVGTKLYLNDQELVVEGPENNYYVMAVGQHRVVAQAWDTAGNILKVTARVACLPVGPYSDCTVLSAGDQIIVAAPTRGALYGSTVPVTARAYADTGAVSHIKVYLDGREVFQADSDSVDTTITATPGEHQIVVQAWTDSGRVFNTVTTVYAR
jgi:hypothetical protein